MAKKDRETHSETEEINESTEVTEITEIAEYEEESELFEELSSEEQEFQAESEQELEALGEAAEIEEIEELEPNRIESIVESVLFASDKPVSMATLKQAFTGTTVKSEHIRRALEALTVKYAGAGHGVQLEEVSNGYQLRTKVDNRDYLRRMNKIRPFKLSVPALEVLAIVAYKQPVVKAEIDQIRGVESGHLLRALMDRRLVTFAGKSDLPGKPMLYATARRFLEVFGLRNLKELPSLNEIDDLIPEGIGAEEEKKETLSDLTTELSEQADSSYSIGEDELLKISEDLQQIQTSTAFFEEEKQRAKELKEQQKAAEQGELSADQTIQPPDEPEPSPAN